ncbi:MAG: hypothetical protein AB4352_06255 [Hormoscilla sp.]
MAVGRQELVLLLLVGILANSEMITVYISTRTVCLTETLISVKQILWGVVKTRH